MKIDKNRIYQIITWAIIVLCAMALFFGCNGQKWCAKRFPPETITRIDSFTQTEYRDTVIFVDGPVLRDTFRVECDSNGQVVVTGGNGEIRYVYKDRWLTVSADCPDTAIVVNRYRELVRVARLKKETVKVPEKYIPWYARTLAWIGGLSLLYCGARAGIRWFMQSV